MNAHARRASSLLLSLALALAACADTTPGPGGGGVKNDGGTTGGLCKDDSACAAPAPRCAVRVGVCVPCLTDADCSSGNVCRAAQVNGATTIQCVPGCTDRRACAPDAGVCEVDAGQCVACATDPDCADPARPRCSPFRRCEPCLPGARDNCGPGLYCARDNAGYACAPGCKTDDDCAPPLDAGDSPDAGARAESPYCDPQSNRCVGCTKNDQCPLGQICTAKACVPGCDEAGQRGCDAGKACCGSACVDLQTDGQHCGACASLCAGGFNCCGGTCKNPAADVSNCGACGTVCAVDNGAPKCEARKCVIDTCAAGFADCNGVYADGCETDLRANPNHCGKCNNACAFPKAQAKCEMGACVIDGCLYPAGDCNKSPADGCEADLLGNPAHCGACGRACSGNHVPDPQCGQGACSGACEPGWDDCNGNRLVDGCEKNVASDPDHCGGCASPCSGNNVARSCAGGACNGACNPGFGDCNADKRGDGCETRLDSLQNCGGCGNACARANAQATCGGGACAIASCNLGYANCDGGDANGCEIDLASASNTCGGAESLGARCGDNACDFLCPGSAYQQLGARSGRGSRWFSGRSNECSTCCADIYARVRLVVPAGMNYDLYVYAGCGNLIASSKNGAGVDEVVTIFNADDCLNSDSGFTYQVEVRYVSGSACGTWTVALDGTSCNP